MHSTPAAQEILAPSLLNLHGVSKTYPPRGLQRSEPVQALREATLELRAGEVVAIVGESGSGKSTLAKLIVGMETADSGQMAIEGQEVRLTRRGRRKNLRREIQLVTQDPFSALNPMHSVRYILSRPLKLYTRLTGDERRKRMEELLTWVGLTPADEFLKRFPESLSGGQRQRINIVRSVAATPKLLIADEPTSMLDVSVRLSVLNHLLDLRSKLGFAMILITHDLAAARYVADRILVLYRGTIMEEGKAKDVIEAPLHPYTTLLRWASPSFEAEAADRPEAKTGLADHACRFASRCPRAFDLCTKTEPQLLKVQGRRVRCHAVS